MIIKTLKGWQQIEVIFASGDNSNNVWLNKALDAKEEFKGDAQSCLSRYMYGPKASLKLHDDIYSILAPRLTVAQLKERKRKEGRKEEGWNLV